MKPRTWTIAGQASEVDAQDTICHLGLPISMRVERRTEAELDTGELEQFRPECAGEDRIPITDDGARNAMEPHDLVEEGARHRSRGVRVPQHNEMRIFGEAVDDGEDDRLAADVREAFHEVEGNVLPHRRGHGQWLKQAGGMQMLGLVALAGGAAVDELAHQAIGSGVVERSP